MATSYPGHNILTQDIGQIVNKKIVNVKINEKDLLFMAEQKSRVERVVAMFQIDNKLYLVGKNTNKFNNLEPFNKQITDFFDYLSKIIFKDHKKSEYKDIIAIGFWFRKNNTNYLKKFFEKHSKFP